jgi:hypothetical protein
MTAPILCGFQAPKNYISVAEGVLQQSVPHVRWYCHKLYVAIMAALVITCILYTLCPQYVYTDDDVARVSGSRIVLCALVSGLLVYTIPSL